MRFLIFFCSTIIFDQKLFSYYCDKFDYLGSIIYLSCSFLLLCNNKNDFKNPYWWFEFRLYIAPRKEFSISIRSQGKCKKSRRMRISLSREIQLFLHRTSRQFLMWRWLWLSVYVWEWEVHRRLSNVWYLPI